MRARRGRRFRSYRGRGRKVFGGRRGRAGRRRMRIGYRM